MAFTFTTLKTAIQDYTQNSETTFVNNLSRFIINAEERIFKEVQLDVFRKNVNGAITSGNKFLTKPTDYLSTFSLSILNNSENVFLLRKHPTFLQDYTPDPSTTGVPQYYADFDETTFLLAPTPSSGFTAELHYYHRPTSITATSDGTSWLGTNAELALLYASLVEAYTFMKGEADMFQIYNARYQEALAYLKNLGEGKNTRDEYRYDKLRKEVIA
tara:strand:- start:15277 stop:15924 length:648 start_codon:yes stop_codon:yes gene_type:complete